MVPLARLADQWPNYMHTCDACRRRRCRCHNDETTFTIGIVSSIVSRFSAPLLSLFPRHFYFRLSGAREIMLLEEDDRELPALGLHERGQSPAGGM